MTQQDHIAIFITTGSIDEARRIGISLLEQKLAACVNIVPGVESHFRWENQIESETENFLVVKTRKSRLAKITAAVKKLHSYDVPEIIALPIIGGNPDYLDWIDRETGDN